MALDGIPSQKEDAQMIYQNIRKRAQDEARDKLIKRFEDSAGREKLDFHNLAHTEGVVRRAENLLEAIATVDPTLITEKTRTLLSIAAWYHDVIQHTSQTTQEETFENEPITKVMRAREVIANEGKSADDALSFMDAINTKSNEIVFTHEDKEMVREAIEFGTEATFVPKEGTVAQPKAFKDTQLITKILALSDIGTAGMEGEEAYKRDGYNLFREENEDIRDAIERAENEGVPISEREQRYFAFRMSGWLRGQIRFVEGREKLTPSEIESFPSHVQEAVQKQFHYFDTTIAAAKKNYTEYKDAPFRTLATLFGYSYTVA